MTEKINPYDVGRRKQELEEKRRVQNKERLERITRTIIDKLAEGKYEGVLEQVINNNLEIERSVMDKLAEYESRSGYSRKVGLAIGAYNRLGEHEKAKSLESKFKQLCNDELIDECNDVWHE